MGKNTAIVGGLLRGVGDYMVKDAESKREEALERARQLAEGQEKREAREYDRSTLSKTVADEDGNIFGVSKGGDVTNLNIRGPKPKGSGKGSGKGYMSPEDKRLWDSTVQRHTTKGLGGEDTDWDAVSATLREQGREDLASMAGPAGGSSDKVKVDSPEYREAQRMADESVDDQATFWGSDEEDFAEHGGSRETARQAKTVENYRTLTGKGATQQPQQKQEKAAAGQQQQKAEAPPGSGTQAAPYKGTTQAHIDWFKNSAPSGAVIQVNGKLYTK